MGAATRVSVTPTRRRKQAAPDKAAIAASADFVTGAIQQIGVMRYGADIGRMSEPEQKMVRGGIEGTLSNLPGDVSKQISSWSAPVMLIMGLMMYGTRCAAHEPQRRANLAERQRASQTDAILEAQRIANTVNGAQNGEITQAERENVPNLDVLRGIAES